MINANEAKIATQIASRLLLENDGVKKIFEIFENKIAKACMNGKYFITFTWSYDLKDDNLIKCYNEYKDIIDEYLKSLGYTIEKCCGNMIVISW